MFWLLITLSVAALPTLQNLQRSARVYSAEVPHSELTSLGTGKVADLGKSTIQLVSGRVVDATITSVDRDGNVAGGDVPNGLNIRDVLSVRTLRTTQRDTTHPVRIHVIGGGLLWISNPSIADEMLAFRSGSGATKLPLQACRAIVWSTSPTVENALKSPSRESDTVIVETADGERGVEGILESLDAEFVGINYKGESRKIGLAKVKAVITADLGLAQAEGSVATVQLVDESRLIGVVVALAGDQLTMDVAAETLIRLDTSGIATISIASDRLLFLSDVEPIEVQEKAIFAVQRSWKRDRSVGDNPLRIRQAGSEKTVAFSKGLGTQASSRLVFANTNDFDRFSAVVGIDAETGGRGDCQMVVRGDGIELWTKRVRGSDGPQEIDVDITGMKQIVLLVYPGEEFDLGDHADWADARFLKSK